MDLVTGRLASGQHHYFLVGLACSSALGYGVQSAFRPVGDPLVHAGGGLFPASAATDSRNGAISFIKDCAGPGRFVWITKKMGGVDFFMKLSARLIQIAERLPMGCKLADIGSDHALLPVYAVKNGLALSAVAGEVNEGPLKAAQQQVAQAGLTSSIAVRKGDGLAVVSPGEVDTITIAGMGGALIASILEAGQEKLAGVHTLVLQPNVGEDLVRRWLLRHEWALTEESILEEDGKIYEILTARRLSDSAGFNAQLYAPRALPGSEMKLTEELLLLLGPWLIKEPNAVWFEKWHGEIKQLERIRSSVASSSHEASRIKEQELAELARQLKEVMECLQKDKQ